IYREAGVAPADRVYFAFSFGPFLGFWTAFEAAAKFGCLSIPGGGLSSAARIRVIVQHRANVLLCTPTYALHLAEVAAREALPLLARSAHALLRCGPGELVRRGPGPGFPLAGGIIGRSDDMVVVRGVNIFPSAVDAVVREIPEIAEYSVRVTRIGEMAELALK